MSLRDREKLCHVDTKNSGKGEQHRSYNDEEVHNSLELLRASVASIRRAAPVARGAHTTDLFLGRGERTRFGAKEGRGVKLKVV